MISILVDDVIFSDAYVHTYMHYKHACVYTYIYI